MEHFLYDIVDKGNSVNQTDAETIISSFKESSPSHHILVIMIEKILSSFSYVI